MNKTPIDKKDLRIVMELDKNARIPTSTLAKKVKLSKPNISYRLQKLKEKQIIRQYTCLINTHALGYYSYRVFFRFQNTNKKNQLIEHFTQDNNIIWFASTLGTWDLEAAFLSKNIIALTNDLKKMLEKYSDVIAEYIISPSIVNYHFPRDYLLQEKRKLLQPTFYGKEPNQISLDKIDILLLKELSLNCRRSNRELSSALGVTHQTIARRLKQLEKQNIIQQFRIQLNISLIKRTHYKVLLFFNKRNYKEELELYAYCSKFPFVIYLIEAVGPWQFEIESECKNEIEFKTFLDSVRAKFPNLLHKLEILHVLKEHKLDYFPIADKMLKEIKNE